MTKQVATSKLDTALHQNQLKSRTKKQLMTTMDVKKLKRRSQLARKIARRSRRRNK
jgi:hypothetical protein